jgi:hypothetical protein
MLKERLEKEQMAACHNEISRIRSYFLVICKENSNDLFPTSEFLRTQKTLHQSDQFAICAVIG